MRIDSFSNPRIKRLLKIKQDGLFRKEEKIILIEGKKLIQECYPLMKGILYTVEEQTIPSNWQQVLISSEIAQKLSDTLHPEQVFAEVALPKEQALNAFPLLAFDAVSDPGNLGTLLRTALAFNWKGVIFLPGCCDPFNPKVLRASKGALFTLPYCRLSSSEFKNFAEERHLTVYAADIEGTDAAALQGNAHVLILGNEGKGLSPDIDSWAKKVTLPMSGKMESLNVSIAGGILMYLLRSKS
jgi:TrmH family RNA methyltransferase